ncbi:glycosyltransferase [Nafulsella turpanensis]|uniref:glycosyltransferase n=1 Tax=Nafulsella turpanensis TaxID=1265690 RepID=UPI001F1A37EB|nr:glycosyltransferase [Nafulsella turpanensis]
MLAEGMSARGHQVKVLSPQPRFYKLPFPMVVKKWFGYIDQFIVFPLEVLKWIASCPANTLFVFTDQALGPWVPLVAGRSHLIHCHDFLAQRSALGEILENVTGWSGRQYQKIIRRGYSRGRNFISVSAHTQSDLHRFLPTTPLSSEVVYNQVAPVFKPVKVAEARCHLSEVLKVINPSAHSVREGYLLHVGANVWYKNKLGVLELYQAWREVTSTPLTLIMIGTLVGANLLNRVQRNSWGKDVVFLDHVQEELLVNAYSGATALLFPSLEEGFGWPIAEAMACGCPVVTTNKAPMTEVGGKAAFYLPRRPAEKGEATRWAQEGAKVIHQVVSLTSEERTAVIQAGFSQVKKFNAQEVLVQVERLYHHVLRQNKTTSERVGSLP